MSDRFRLDEAQEGQLYEIVAINDEKVSHATGANQGMSVVVLKKALQSIVQFGYSQIEIERDMLRQIVVQTI